MGYVKLKTVANSISVMGSSSPQSSGSGRVSVLCLGAALIVPLHQGAWWGCGGTWRQAR